jgi:hypothetical protein
MNLIPPRHFTVDPRRFTVDRPGGIIGDTADRNGRQAVADKPLRLGEAMRKHWPEYLMEAWGLGTLHSGHEPPAKYAARSRDVMSLATETLSHVRRSQA